MVGYRFAHSIALFAGEAPMNRQRDFFAAEALAEGMHFMARPRSPGKRFFPRILTPAQVIERRKVAKRRSRQRAQRLARKIRRQHA